MSMWPCCVSAPIKPSSQYVFFSTILILPLKRTISALSLSGKSSTSLDCGSVVCVVKVRPSTQFLVWKEPGFQSPWLIFKDSSPVRLYGKQAENWQVTSCSSVMAGDFGGWVAEVFHVKHFPDRCSPEILPSNKWRKSGRAGYFLIKALKCSDMSECSQPVWHWIVNRSESRFLPWVVLRYRLRISGIHNRREIAPQFPFQHHRSQFSLMSVCLLAYQYEQRHGFLWGRK